MRFIERLSKKHKELSSQQKRIKKPVLKKSRLTLADLVIVYGLSRALDKNRKGKEKRARAFARKLYIEREENRNVKKY